MADDDDADLAWLRRVCREYRDVPAAMARLIDRGHSVDDVAAAAGVHRSTVWRRVGAARAAHHREGHTP